MEGIDKIMRAAALAGRAHAGQVDKSGVNYINHPLTVASDVASDGFDYRYVVTALLHDVAEDTEITVKDIGEMFPENPEIAEALAFMTHEDSVPYMEYVKNLGKNPIARAVKMADLRHNMNTSRMKEMTEWYERKLKIYREAYALLEKIEKEVGNDE